MQPVISVIIPTLNEENYLPKLLTDLKEQTEKKFEIIIVDAFSEDKTKENALKFKDDLDLHFIESPKKNPSYQRNLAASKARGEYLFFMDADTRVTKNAIEKAVMHIRKENYGLYLPVILSSSTKKRYHLLVSFTVLSVKILQKVGVPLSIGPIMLVKKDLFDKIDGFNVHIVASEDHNLVIKAHKLGVKAHFLSDVLCYFSMRRFERDGMVNILWKYLFFLTETLFKGGVHKTSHHYEMGGKNYEKASFTE